MLSRQDVHRQLLGHLLSLRGDCVSRVRLVARVYNDELLGGASAARVFVFLPDLHLMTAEGNAAYRYGFQRQERDASVDRTTLLDGLARVLLNFWNALPAGQSLKTVQLGDFLDLWRESELRAESVSGQVERVLGDNGKVRARLVRRGSDSLEADLVAGNHDAKIGESLALRHARRGLGYAIGGTRSLLCTHGDAFDPLEEKLRVEVKEYFVERFGPLVGAVTYAVDRSREAGQGKWLGPQGGPPLELDAESDSLALPDWVNVWLTTSPCPPEALERSHPLLGRVLEFARGIRAGRKPFVSRLDLDGPMAALRTLVIGHTHAPRICLHVDRADPGDNLVLLDCGAWIEKLRFPDAVVPACSVGVLCGGDARIYQLDPHPGLLR